MTDDGVVDHSKTMMMAATELVGAPKLRRRERSQADVQGPSFAEVYEAHFDFVWRTARRLGCSEEALDDVAQDVFIVVHRKLSAFEGRSSVKTWLYAITRRVVADHRRKQHRRRPTNTPFHDERAVSPDAGPQELAARQQAATLLYSFLESLPDEQREVFVLAELEQMTAPEIVEATGVKLNTVYSRLRLARRAFERVVARQAAKRKER